MHSTSPFLFSNYGFGKRKRKTPACFYLLGKKLLLMKFLILVWKTTLRTMDKYRFVVLIQKRPIVFIYQELRSAVTILKKCSRKVIMCSVSTKRLARIFGHKNVLRAKKDLDMDAIFSLNWNADGRAGQCQSLMVWIRIIDL